MRVKIVLNAIRLHPLRKCGLPGQWRTKQTSDVFPSPAQSFPSWAGAGLLHDRTRVLVPLSHVLLQVDQVSQADQFPSTRDNGEEEEEEE